MAQLANGFEEFLSLGKDGAVEAQSTARKLLILQLLTVAFSTEIGSLLDAL